VPGVKEKVRERGKAKARGKAKEKVRAKGRGKVRAKGKVKDRDKVLTVQARLRVRHLPVGVEGHPRAESPARIRRRPPEACSRKRDRKTVTAALLTVSMPPKPQPVT
jgi:hypothetical protein